MEAIIELISNYGIGIVCVGYMIYFQHTTMREMLTTLSSINERLTLIESHVGIKRSNKKKVDDKDDISSK